MKQTLTKLEEEKAILQTTKEDLERHHQVVLTENMIKVYLEKDKQVILSGDLQACKSIICNYVKKVIVYEDYIDVILKIVDFNVLLGKKRCHFLNIFNLQNRHQNQPVPNRILLLSQKARPIPNIVLQLYREGSRLFLEYFVLYHCNT